MNMNMNMNKHSIIKYGIYGRDYFNDLLEMSKDETRRALLSSSGGEKYIPSYIPTDLRILDGIEIMDRKNKKRITHTHPAFEIFMDWRELEIVKENIQKEGHTLVLRVFELRKQKERYKEKKKKRTGEGVNRDEKKKEHMLFNKCFLSYIEERSNDIDRRKRFEKWAIENSRISTKKKSTSQRCHEELEKWILSYRRAIEQYKRNAHLHRFLEKTQEIREEAIKQACPSKDIAIVSYDSMVRTEVVDTIDKSDQTQNIHPAFDIFIEWWELLIRKKDNDNERHMIANDIFAPDNHFHVTNLRFFMSSTEKELLRKFCQSYRYDTENRVTEWLDHEHPEYPENPIKKALKRQDIHTEGTSKLLKKFMEYDPDNPAKQKNIHLYQHRIKNQKQEAQKICWRKEKKKRAEGSLMADAEKRNAVSSQERHRTTFINTKIGEP